MKSKNAQKYIETLHDASALLAFHSVELAEADLIEIAINAHWKSCPNLSKGNDRMCRHLGDCDRKCLYMNEFINQLKKL